MKKNIRLGDYGTSFVLTAIGEKNFFTDISDATDLSVIFKKPSGDILTKTAQFLNDGTDGRFVAVTEIGDINEAGRWEFQGKIITPTGSWTSSEEVFYVEKTLS